MMFTRSYARILFLFLIALIVLLSPSFIRSSKTYVGEDAYFYSRLSEKIDTNDYAYDELSYSGRYFTYPLGQPLIFLFFSKLFSEYFVINIFPVILALFSLFLFYKILKEFYIEPNVIYVSLISLIISPPFIYTFSSYNEFTSVTFFILLALYFFIKENSILHGISYFLLFIIPFFGYKYSILVLALILIYCITEKKIKRFYKSLIISTISLSVIYLPAIYKFGLSESAIFDKEIKYKYLFSDLGSNLGISIFIIFLSFFGLNYLWKSKYKYLHAYLLLIFFIIFLFYYPQFIIYLNFMLSVLSAFGLIYLLRSKWESETVRKLTMWFLVIGLCFSTAIFITETSKEEPNLGLYEALIFLKNYDNSKEVVFSHYSYGALINAIADKKNIMDSNFLYAPKLNEHYADSQNLFHTRNFNTASDIADKYNIKYILITKEMREGLIWEQEDDGLLFLLNSINEYKKIYSNNDVEIWRIKK